MQGAGCGKAARPDLRGAKGEIPLSTCQGMQDNASVQHTLSRLLKKANQLLIQVEVGYNAATHMSVGIMGNVIGNSKNDIGR